MHSNQGENALSEKEGKKEKILFVKEEDLINSIGFQ